MTYVYVVTDTDNLPIAVVSTPEKAQALVDWYESKRQSEYHGYWNVREFVVDDETEARRG